MKCSECNRFTLNDEYCDECLGQFLVSAVEAEQEELFCEQYERLCEETEEP